MIFADKLIRLRKKNGWSQEELADKMNVSRQAVSKWEGAQTVPDLQKMLMLAQLFGVTTDYLLRDELEQEEYTDTDTDKDPAIRRVTMAEANEYMALRRTAAKRIALATFLCILSAIPLLLLGGATEYGLNENLAGGVGVIALILIIAPAVAIYIHCDFQVEPYTFLDKEPFDMEYGVRGMVQQRQKEFRDTYVRSNIIATCICVVSPVPLLAGAFTEVNYVILVALCLTMVIAGLGVALFITVGVPWASMQRLLKEGDFAPEVRKREARNGALSTAYWLIATAIYLAISFTANDWHTSWILWPVAGVLYGALMAISGFFGNKNDT